MNKTCWASDHDCEGRTKQRRIIESTAMLCDWHYRQYASGRYSFPQLLARHYKDDFYLNLIPTKRPTLKAGSR